MSAPAETCNPTGRSMCFSKTVSVFKQQNGLKNFVLPRDWECGAGQDGSEQPRRKVGRAFCSPSSGLPPKGCVFWHAVAKNVKCERCAEVCRLALSAWDWSVLGADIPGEVSLHRLPLLISPRDRDDSLSISLRRSSFVCETNRRCRRMYYFSANILYLKLKFLTGLPK